MRSKETAIEKKPFVRILVHSQTPSGPGVPGDQSSERMGVSNEPPIASASESAQSQQSSQSALINSDLTSNNDSLESFETADEEHENDPSNHELTPSTSRRAEQTVSLQRKITIAKTTIASQIRTKIEMNFVMNKHFTYKEYLQTSTNLHCNSLLS